MVALANTLEGGSNTTVITAANSGGGSGNAFDYVSPACTYSSTHAMHGSLSAEIATTTSATAELQWAASIGTQTELWFRAYYYFTANPGVNTRILNFLTSAVANDGTIWVTTAGTVIWGNTAGTTILTSGTTIPTGAWFRLEGYIIPSTTTGQMSMSMWKTSPDSSGTADDVQTSAATVVLGTNVEYANFGLATATASIGPYWIDDPAVSSTGYLGSSGSSGTSATAGLASAGQVLPGTPAASVSLGMTIQGA